MGTIVNINHTSVGTELSQAEYEAGAHGFTAPLILNNNSTTPQAAPASTVLHLAGADGFIARALLDVYGTSTCATFTGRAARGTAASPSALQSGDQITELSAHGYGATGYSASGRAHVRAEADENWTDASHPTRWIFDVTPSGTIVPVEALRIMSTGYIGINEAAPDCQLHIKGTHVGGIGILMFEGTTHAYMTAAAAAGNEAGFMFKEGATRYWQIKQTPTAQNLEYATASGSLGTCLILKSTGQLTFPLSINSAAVVDEVSIGGYDISAGHRALAISSEEVVVAAVGIASAFAYPVEINGTAYDILMRAHV